jgi:nicotinamidase-related amidase
MAMASRLSIPARPYPFPFDIDRTALIIIDMQRDFLLKGGYGDIECGNDEAFEACQHIIPATVRVLKACRDAGMHIIHTREGHRPDLFDVPAPKIHRQDASPKGQHHLSIGDRGSMGRLLVRGEWGHDIIDELRPRINEYVVDKPGKGAFYHTDLYEHLVDRGITHLFFCGVTVECCVTTTLREANDRGFEPCLLSDCTEGFVPQFKQSSIDVVWFSEGLFGWVAESSALTDALASLHPDPLSSTSSAVFEGPLTVKAIKASYASGVSPVAIVQEVYRRVEAYKARDGAVWISIVPEEQALARARELEAMDDKLLLPLYGVPFAVKVSRSQVQRMCGALCNNGSF